MTPTAYNHLLRHARRQSRRPDEAEDLLQTVLLAAVKAGRDDVTYPQNRRWIIGALRKRAAFEARSALRRRLREGAQPTPEIPLQNTRTDAFLSTLPPALKRTALLALSGHTKAEITHLLRTSDTALRQRFVQIRQRWHTADGEAISGMPGLRGHLPFGLIRRALRLPIAHPQAHLGSHDPDGHLFVLSIAHKTAHGGNS